MTNRRNYNFAFIFGLIFLMSCGYFENDKTDTEISVIGNIKLTKQENSSDIDLVLQESAEVAAVVVQNCKGVYIDSSRRHVLVESEINEYNKSYFHIIVKDSISRQVTEALTKTKISSEDFSNTVTVSKFKNILD